MKRSTLDEIAHQVATRPRAIALVHDARSWTYAELWAYAEQGAADLRRHGVGTGDVVALVLPRGPRLAAGVLASWLCGAAYLPVDPTAPAPRRRQILEDAAPRRTVSEQTWPLPPTDAAVREPDAAPPSVPQLSPETPAYLIYTSGTTGTPKGVRIPHRALANLTTHLRDVLGAGPGTRMLWLTQFSFDMSVPELFVPLAAGGTCVVAPDAARSDGRVLAAAVRTGEPDIVQATPSSWRLALDDVGPELAGRVVMIGGESSTPELVAALLHTGARVLHCYGPTETTVWSTMGWITAAPAQPVPVGVPIAETTVVCLGPDGEEVAPGETGEVWIGGTGVALDYHARPELTAAVFVDRARLGRGYRTGDLGRWNADGELELLGRADRQVKLHGNRIELGDVEAALCRHPLVREAAVQLVEDGQDRWLGAVVSGADPVAADLFAHVRGDLPRSMVPSEIRIVDSLPLTANRKVDHRAVLDLLSRPETPPAPTTTDDVDADADADADDTHAGLAGIWAELLPAGAPITADTHFFLSGGHSLLAAICLQRIESRWGVSLALDTFFAHPTLADLAALIEPGSGVQGASASPQAPLECAQARPEHAAGTAGGAGGEQVRDHRAPPRPGLRTITTHRKEDSP